MGALLAPPGGGLVMALPCQTVRPQGRAIAMGVYFVYFMYFYGGMGVLLPVASLARDLTGSTATPLWFAGALLYIAIAMLLFFRAIQSHASSPSSGPPGHAIASRRAHTLLMRGACRCHLPARGTMATMSSHTRGRGSKSRQVA
jgi:hypothetical protein